MKNKILTITIITLLTLTTKLATTNQQTNNPNFNEQRAYQDILYQVSLGPRPVGSIAQAETRIWIIETLQQYGWEVELQETSWAGQTLYNIIAKRGTGPRWVIFGAHYDTRFVADRDSNPDNRQEAVLGANDGASGVAILLELARSIPPLGDEEIWLVFFDGEDNGDYPGWDWILGSRFFVTSLQNDRVSSLAPDAVIIVDMIGDSDLQIYKEKNSSFILNNEIFTIANELGYQQFISHYKYRIIDDHLPFIEAGIPAIDLIDFDYPYWHTTQDTADKVSPDSLEAVGTTLLAWLLNN